MHSIDEHELETLRRFVSERYTRSGLAPDVVRALDSHNDRVLEHVNEIARGEQLDERDTQVLRTIAVLHDVAKADTHLMLHGGAGAKIAAEQLRGLGKDEAFVAAVTRGIETHMGPFPFIEEEARKYAERTGVHLHFPRPSTKVDQLFYDADMLALVEIDGIEKVVVLRSTTPEFTAEDEEIARLEGITAREASYRSALQSVRRAADTLHSRTARSIAERLVALAERHVAERCGRPVEGQQP